MRAHVLPGGDYLWNKIFAGQNLRRHLHVHLLVHDISQLAEGRFRLATEDYSVTETRFQMAAMSYVRQTPTVQP